MLTSQKRSNKIVPQIYRSIIDDVIQNIQVDFEEYGMEEELLTTLQAKWEAKLLETRVADFARAVDSPPAEDEFQQQHQHPLPPTSQRLPPPLPNMTSSGLNPLLNNRSNMPYPYNQPSIASSSSPSSSSTFQQGSLTNSSSMINGNGNGNVNGSGLRYPLNPNGQAVYGSTSGVGNGSGNANPNGMYDGNTRIKSEPGLSDELLRLRGGASSSSFGGRGMEEDVKPKIEGLGGGNVSTSTSTTTTGSAGQSQPQPQPNAAGLLPGDDIIDSDLDDSDDGRDDGEGGEDEGEIDIVFCVYDKVQRVKNKWKTVFKDGMIHVNGRDYLFSKCNGEFEW